MTLESTAIELLQREHEAEVQAFKARQASDARAISQLRGEVAEYRADAQRVGRIESKLIEPVKWEYKGKGDDLHHGTVNLFLSDLHLDEIVDPESMDWVNAYDREIAHKRIERLVNNTISLSRDYFSGVHYDGMCMPVGGDMFSGFIHEELTETNEDTVLASVEYWEDPIAGIIETFASEFGNLLVPVTYGNHGRYTKRMRAKQKAKTNFEWLAWRHIAKHFKGSEHVKFIIPQAAQTRWTSYGTKFLMVHGNEFRGGDGITGPLRPILLGHQRKTRREVALQTPYDIMLLGHWHTYTPMAQWGVIINGSLKGYDEFAADCNFSPEPAQQAFFITTPEHGVTFQAPVIVQKREDEGW